MSSQEPERAAMAAAPGEAPVPMAAPVLPPAKRVKKDPAPPATATADWSSLPDDLVRRIADCFLVTNDVDCYLDFRAVCPNWRAATDDPRNNASDPRFHPRQWIVLDEVFQSGRDRRILLNTYTGRFLHMKLPLLLDYYVVATTSSGFFVLADRSPPHAARLFNPLTGAVIRFAAPVPVPVEVAVADIDIGAKDAPLVLSLFGDSSRMIYSAAQDSEGFISSCLEEFYYNIFRNVVVGGASSHQHTSMSIRGVGRLLGGAIAELSHLLRSLDADFAKFFSIDYNVDAGDIRCFVVDLAGHMLPVLKTEGTPYVFKINTEKGKLSPVKSVGRFAIFIGHHRCLAVDTDKFPGIEANCVYCTYHVGSKAHICKCNIENKNVEIFSDGAEFLKQDKQFVLVADRPFTIIQLLCSYTINYSVSELALQKMV